MKRIFIFRTDTAWVAKTESSEKYTDNHGVYNLGSQALGFIDRVTNGCDYGYLNVGKRKIKNSLRVQFIGRCLLKPRLSCSWTACKFGIKFLDLKRDKRIRIRYIRFSP